MERKFFNETFEFLKHNITPIFPKGIGRVQETLHLRFKATYTKFRLKDKSCNSDTLLAHRLQHNLSNLYP